MSECYETCYDDVMYISAQHSIELLIPTSTDWTQQPAASLPCIATGAVIMVMQSGISLPNWRK